MSSLPIVERELRCASRNWKTYWGRTSAAALSTIVCGFIIFATDGLRPSESGRITFLVLASLLALGCLFAGPAVTADCLSSEKREGTLGFLFLTDLRVLDILTGKLAAGSLRILYSVCASVPVVGLPILMGGISFWEFVRVIGTLGCILLFSLSAGLLSSALFKTAQNAVGWCFIFLATISGGLPLFVTLWSANHNQQPKLFWMSPSPGLAMFGAFNEGYGLAPILFYISNGILVLIALTCLGLAARVLPKRWQDRPGTVRRQLWREWWRDFKFGDATFRAGLRRKLLDVEAFL